MEINCKEMLDETMNRANNYSEDVIFEYFQIFRRAKRDREKSMQEIKIYTGTFDHLYDP